MIKEFSALWLCLCLLFQSTDVLAEYDADFGGWTEVIACPITSWDTSALYHETFYWGGSGPNISYISPPGWWTYGDEGDDAFNCNSWVNGSLVGGASYSPTQASVPQGVDVRINTNWWDFINTDFSTTCNHQYVSTYVWGWRMNANSWSFEFVTAHTLSSFLNDKGMCVFQGEGNPDYTNDLLKGFAFGDQTLLIENSPYAVLYTKSQANSHYGAGCGAQGCLHAVRVAVTYEGGPGIKRDVKPSKVAIKSTHKNSAPKNSISQNSISQNTISKVFFADVQQFDKEAFVKPLAMGAKGAMGELTRGAKVGLEPGWKELAQAAEEHLILNFHTNGISKVLPLDEMSVARALQVNPLLACEMSYIQTFAAIKNHAADVDVGAFPALTMASYDAFISDCLNMPQDIQKCQVFEYIKDNYEQCQQARRKHNIQLKMQASLTPSD